MIWKRRHLDRLIEKVEAQEPTEVVEARKARLLAEKAQHEIESQNPEVVRLRDAFSLIRERNNFAAYWKSALRGD